MGAGPMQTGAQTQPWTSGGMQQPGMQGPAQLPMGSMQSNMLGQLQTAGMQQPVMPQNQQFGVMQQQKTGGNGYQPGTGLASVDAVPQGLLGAGIMPASRTTSGGTFGGGGGTTGPQKGRLRVRR